MYGAKERLRRPRKVFDGVCGWGIFTAVMLVFTSPALAQPKPAKGGPVPAQVSAEDEEELSFTAKVIAGEAMVERGRKEGRYVGLEPEADFLKEIIESAKNSPF